MNMEKKLNSLKEYVKKKALSEAEKIKREAEEKAKSIEREYQEKAEREYTEILRESKRKAELLERKEISQARARSSRMLLDAKNDILRKALQELRKAVYSLAQSEEYDVLLEKLTREAVETLGKRDLIVSVRKEDVKRMKKIVQKVAEDMNINLEISERNVEISGGLIASVKEGHVIVENTLENKFEEVKDEFVSALFSILNVDG